MPRQHPIVVNLADDAKTAEITVYGFVGHWRADLESLEDALAGRSLERIRVRINTLGGLAHEGIAMHNVLRAHPARVEVIVEGIAGSAGSIVAMAGDEITMYANALMMIHGTRAVDEWGDELDTPEARAAVEAFDRALLETYRARTGKSDEALRAMLATDTWMTAREAVAAGFADRVQELTRAPEGEPAPTASALSLIASVTDVPAAALARAEAEAAGQGGQTPPAAEGDQGGEGNEGEGEGRPAGEEEGQGEPVPTATFAGRVHALAERHGLADHAAAWLLDGGINTMAEARAAIVEAREVRDLCAFAGQPEAAAHDMRAWLETIRTTYGYATDAGQYVYRSRRSLDPGHLPAWIRPTLPRIAGDEEQ